MAEFCLTCLNKLMHTNEPKTKYIISRWPDLCEECGEMKPVVIRKRRIWVAIDCCQEIRDGILSCRKKK